MQITRNMSLEELEQRMGDVATRREAAALREILVARHNGEQTQDIDEWEWADMVREAVEAAGEPHELDVRDAERSATLDGGK